jgi:site-specific DNA-methyltransferase (adenine-specific)
MQLIHGDCLPEMMKMADKSVDLVLTDPPYGLKMAHRGKIGGRKFTPKQWDSCMPKPEYFYEMRRVAKNLIIWGGNYFTAHLDPSRGWLVWYKNDKLPTLTFADCELAWTSFDCNARIFNCRHRGFIKDSKETQWPFPTQKALAVMKWCFELFSNEGDTVLDPFRAAAPRASPACLLVDSLLASRKTSNIMRWPKNGCSWRSRDYSNKLLKSEVARDLYIEKSRASDALCDPLEVRSRELADREAFMHQYDAIDAAIAQCCEAVRLRLATCTDMNSMRRFLLDYCSRYGYFRFRR